MIIYATKQTFERYKLKLPTELTPPLNGIAEVVIENESGDSLLVCFDVHIMDNLRKSLEERNTKESII